MTNSRINCIHGVVDLLSNFQSIGYQKWRMVLIFYLASIGFPPLWVDKTAVFMHILFYNKIIVNELLSFHDVLFTHAKFISEKSEVVFYTRVTPCQMVPLSRKLQISPNINFFILSGHLLNLIHGKIREYFTFRISSVPDKPTETRVMTTCSVCFWTGVN